MPTKKELYKEAQLLNIRGRSTMNKEELEAAIKKAKKKSKSKKKSKKSQAKLKKTLKELRKACKDLGLVYDKEVFEPPHCRESKRKKKSKKPKKINCRLNKSKCETTAGCRWIVGTGCRPEEGGAPDEPEPDDPEHVPKPNRSDVDYGQIMKNYIAGEPASKTINKLTKEYRIDRLNSVKFHGTKFGKVDFFKKCLKDSLGENWAERVLDKEESLDNVDGISRLGIPGRQGTTIKIKAKCCAGGNNECKYYAVKVAPKGTACGDGATGGMGFLKQARMQQLASEHGVTIPVDAVYCGGKKDVSFMVMAPLKTRFVDFYGKGETVSTKHQHQLWDLYRILDQEVGIMHNDSNCLNIMLDKDDNLMLIDFDRSKVTEKKDIKKWGPYINLNFLNLVNCFKKYRRIPGKELVHNYIKLFRPTERRRDGTEFGIGWYPLETRVFVVGDRESFRGVGYGHIQNAGLSGPINRQLGRNRSRKPTPMKDIDSVDIEWSK